MTYNDLRQVGANRPDIVLRDKASRKTYIIDVSCPSDMNVLSNENETRSTNLSRVVIKVI